MRHGFPREAQRSVTPRRHRAAFHGPARSFLAATDVASFRPQPARTACRNKPLAVHDHAHPPRPPFPAAFLRPPINDRRPARPLRAGNNWPRNRPEGRVTNTDVDKERSSTCAPDHCRSVEDAFCVSRSACIITDRERNSVHLNENQKKHIHIALKSIHCVPCFCVTILQQSLLHRKFVIFQLLSINRIASHIATMSSFTSEWILRHANKILPHATQVLPSLASVP